MSHEPWATSWMPSPPTCSPLGDSLKNRLYAGDASASRELEAFQLSPGESGDSGGGDMRGGMFFWG